MSFWLLDAKTKKEIIAYPDLQVYSLHPSVHTQAVPHWGLESALLQDLFERIVLGCTLRRHSYQSGEDVDVEVVDRKSYTTESLHQ
jgi:hypothetical protein